MPQVEKTKVYGEEGVTEVFLDPATGTTYSASEVVQLSDGSYWAGDTGEAVVGTFPVGNGKTGQMEIPVLDLMYPMKVNPEDKYSTRGGWTDDWVGPTNRNFGLGAAGRLSDDTPAGPGDDTATTGSPSGNNGGWGGGSSSSGGGWGDGYPSGFGRSDDNPVPMYADGWISPFFGGDYTRAEWLAMQYPESEDDWDGPARLPELPKSFNLDVFGGNPPGNPFYGNSSSSGGYGGGGLARTLYQKFAGKFMGDSGYGTSSSGYPSEADYNKSERQAERDAKQREQEYQQQQVTWGLQSKPEWGMTALWGKDFAFNPAYGHYQNALPLNGLQFIVDGKTKAKKLEDPKKYKRHLADMYSQISGRNGVLDYSNMRDTIFGSGRGSLLSRQFQHQQPGEARYSDDGIYQGYKEGKWKWNSAPDQASTAGVMMDALHRSTLAPQMADFRNLLVERTLAGWGGSNKGAKVNPGSALKYLKRQGF